MSCRVVFSLLCVLLCSHSWWPLPFHSPFLQGVYTAYHHGEPWHVQDDKREAYSGAVSLFFLFLFSSFSPFSLFSPLSFLLFPLRSLLSPLHSFFSPFILFLSLSSFLFFLFLAPLSDSL